MKRTIDRVRRMGRVCAAHPVWSVVSALAGVAGVLVSVVVGAGAEPSRSSPVPQVATSPREPARCLAPEPVPADRGTSPAATS